MLALKSQAEPPVRQAAAPAARGVGQILRDFEWYDAVALELNLSCMSGMSGGRHICVYGVCQLTKRAGAGWRPAGLV
jgi:hypothetical protein